MICVTDDIIYRQKKHISLKDQYIHSFAHNLGNIFIPILLLYKICVLIALAVSTVQVATKHILTNNKFHN